MPRRPSWPRCVISAGQVAGPAGTFGAPYEDPCARLKRAFQTGFAWSRESEVLRDRVIVKHRTQDSRYASLPSGRGADGAVFPVRQSGLRCPQNLSGGRSRAVWLPLRFANGAGSPFLATVHFRRGISQDHCQSWRSLCRTSPGSQPCRPNWTDFLCHPEQ